MAKVCEVCGKKPVHGHRTIHKHSKGWKYRAPKTNRVWNPNLRDVNVTIEGMEVKIRMCMSCYRKYQVDNISYIRKKNPLFFKRLMRKVQKQA